jgi:hypothetical protein
MAFDFSSIGKWLTNGENLKGLGTAAATVGNLYNGYQQSKYAKELLAFDKAQYNRSIDREDKMDSSLNTAFTLSELNKKKKAPTTGLVALG